MSYYPSWKKLVLEKAPDVLIRLATHAFESSLTVVAVPVSDIQLGMESDAAGGDGWENGLDEEALLKGAADWEKEDGAKDKTPIEVGNINPL